MAPSHPVIVVTGSDLAQEALSLLKGFATEAVDHHALGNCHQEMPWLLQFSGHRLRAFGQQ